ncbi:S41 family peptidase [Allosphingosinicella indica]|nr:S41 family peptidase [Allosphingosinicella indica]
MTSPAAGWGNDQAALAPDTNQTVESLAKTLEDNFVFPDVAADYARMLRAKQAAGAYAALTDPAALAAALTADLQAVHPDNHLKVVPPQAAKAGEKSSPPPMPAGGLERSGWIADGVAYVEFTLFPGDKKTLDGIAAFIGNYGDARAVIIDARRHKGGGLAEMDALFPALFEAETQLVGMDTRLAVEQAMGPMAPDLPTLRRVAGPDGVVRRMHFAMGDSAKARLGKAKVFLLVSGKTGSAAEHLSLSLKRTGRATLIGEPTGGAGHYGGMMPIAAGYSVFVPVGRTFDPDTGEGWEGKGVAPDVAVPADQALLEALRLAGVADVAAAAGRFPGPTA